jgi:hypothetical protein
VPVNGAATPAAVISAKSASDKETAAQVNVLAVPKVSDCIKTLCVGHFFNLEYFTEYLIQNS